MLKPIHPTVVRVAAAIMLGGATTVAVAWSLALFVDGTGRWRLRYDVASQVVPTPPQSPQQTGVHFGSVMRARRWGTEIVSVSPTWAEDGRPAYGSVAAVLEGVPFAAEVKEKIDMGDPPCAVWRADGWPLLALSAEARWGWEGDDTVTAVGGLVVGSNKARPGDRVRILPLQPIWYGLITNVVLFILSWYAILSVGSMRYALRRGRGLCGHCGYILRPEQARCSECGASSK